MTHRGCGKVAAREGEVAGLGRRPVQRPATGEMTQKRRGRKVGQGGEMRDCILRDRKWGSHDGRKR